MAPTGQRIPGGASACTATPWKRRRCPPQPPDPRVAAMIRKALVLVAVALAVVATVASRYATTVGASEFPRPPDDDELHAARLDGVIKEFSIQQATFDQALDRLRDVGGINLVVSRLPEIAVASQRRITLILRDVTAGQLLETILVAYR